MKRDPIENVYVQFLLVLAERTGEPIKTIDRVLTEATRYWDEHPEAMRVVNDATIYG